jgi:hypothetical protein
MQPLKACLLAQGDYTVKYPFVLRDIPELAHSHLIFAEIF